MLLGDGIDKKQSRPAKIYRLTGNHSMLLKVPANFLEQEHPHHRHMQLAGPLPVHGGAFDLSVSGRLEHHAGMLLVLTVS